MSIDANGSSVVIFSAATARLRNFFVSLFLMGVTADWAMELCFVMCYTFLINLFSNMLLKC